MPFAMTRSLRLGLSFLLFTCAAPHALRADTPLEEEMDKMKYAFRGLRAALEAPADAEKDEYVALADNLRAAAIASKNLEPRKTRSIPEDKRAEFLAGYRQSMDDLTGLADALKTKLAAADWNGAREQITLINQAQRDGHKEFRSEDD